MKVVCEHWQWPWHKDRAAGRSCDRGDFDCEFDDVPCGCRNDARLSSLPLDDIHRNSETAGHSHTLLFVRGPGTGIQGSRTIDALV